MIALKKIYGDELLRLALVLSLLKADPENYLRQEQQLSAGLNLSNGTDWSLEQESRTLLTPRFVHPKSLDNILLNYEREVFEELNSLGRYHNSYSSFIEDASYQNNERMSSLNSVGGQQTRLAGNVVHTYLVNNVATETVPALLDSVSSSIASLGDASERTGLFETSLPYDHVSHDDNVAQEVRVSLSEDDTEEGADEESSDHLQISDDADVFEEESLPESETVQSSRTLPDAEVSNQSFNVSDFFVKTEAEDRITGDSGATGLDRSSVEVKKEKEENLYDDEDDALGNFLPYFADKNQLYDPFADVDSVFDQNMADLQDYDETLETLKEFKRNFEYLDVKQQQENLEQYLLENTPLEMEAYDLKPIFEDERFLLDIKLERASTSFSSDASFSGVSGESDWNGAEVGADDALGAVETVSSVRVKVEADDDGANKGAELTQEDMDLIEVLWKQDVDMGFTLDGPVAVPVATPSETDLKKLEEPGSEKATGTTKLPPEEGTELDDIASLKAKLLEDAEGGKKEDPWSGLSYTIDTETGEFVLQGELPGELVGESEPGSFDLLDEALRFVALDDRAERAETERAADETAPPHGEQQDELVSEAGETETMLHPGCQHGGGASPHHLGHHHLGHHHHHHHSHHHHHLGSPHHHHSLAAAYHHQSIMRQMSAEQRWQDLASLLAMPPPPQAAAEPYATPAAQPPATYHQLQHQLHHAHHAQQHAQTQPTSGLAPHPHLSGGGAYAAGYSPLAPPEKHVADAVYGHPPVPLELPQPGYKQEAPPQHYQPGQDPLYYQNSSSDMNTTSDGLLSSILNDEDLQLMDMAMNEGMYTMRPLEGAGGAPQAPIGAPHAAGHPTHLMLSSERVDSSSDSAVSSMGSERVPSLSDGEWCDGGSDSAQEYHSSKFRPYDSYAAARPTTGDDRGAAAPPALVAQKKHHMFGKRAFQEQSTQPVENREPRMAEVVKYEYPETQHAGYHTQDAAIANELKYSCTLEFSARQAPGYAPPRPAPHGERVRHNHTYSMPVGQLGAAERPQSRDKRARRLTDGSLSDCGSSPGGGTHMTRDEKRAKALGIPLNVQDIINLPMDEFNERLSKHDLSEAQLSLIRDIRRRGKNKVAAQNCRKRKLDQITSLADEVRTVRDRTSRLRRDQQSLLAERQRVKDRFATLYRHVFQNLRDADGAPLSSQQFSLQQAADGSVVLVPRTGSHSGLGLQAGGSGAEFDRERHLNRTSDEELERKNKNYEQ